MSHLRHGLNGSGVLRDAEDGGLQMLQHSAQSDFFDFGRILADDPAGSFLSRMEARVYGVGTRIVCRSW